MEQHSSKNGSLELREVHDRAGTMDSDDAALSRLGKKPVLKVCMPLYPHTYMQSCRKKTGTDPGVNAGRLATVWLLVDSGVQLYGFDHLGGIACVGLPMRNGVGALTGCVGFFSSGFRSKRFRAEGFGKQFLTVEVVGPRASYTGIWSFGWARYRLSLCYPNSYRCMYPS